MLYQLVEGHWLEMVVKVTAGLGLRREEICGLKWESVDFQRRVVHIKEARTAYGATVVQKETKNRSSMRTLFMPDELYELLRREKARQDRDEDRDERTRYNTYRSRALTFRVLFCLNFVILAGCFIGWWRSGEQEVYIQTAVPCMVLFIVGWITRIASDFYYEFKG